MSDREMELFGALERAIEIIEGYNKRDSRIEELDAILLGKTTPSEPQTKGE